MLLPYFLLRIISVNQKPTGLTLKFGHRILADFQYYGSSFEYSFNRQMGKMFLIIVLTFKI